MNKLLIFLFLLICNFHPVCSQNNGHQNKNNNEAIQQIRTSGLADIQSFQTLNRGVSNMVMTQQVGDQNKASVNQQASPGMANQSFSIQQGNSNEMNVEQIGSGNLLLGFQLGYMVSEQSRQHGNHFGYGLGNGNGNAYAYGHDNKDNESLMAGERNKLSVSQEGSNNSMMTIQQGNDNSISAEQKGTNNYLFLLQRGRNNSVTGFVQANTSENVLLDTIIQQGEGLTMNASEASKSKTHGNSFIQSGVNLSLQVNNQFSNILGGIEINQHGRDMNVVIDQSYFSFPNR